MKTQKAVIKTIVVHRVIGNTDTTEGRGRSFTLGWLFSHADAIEFAKGKGVMGTPADVESRTEQVVMFVDDAGQPIPGEAYILGEQVWTPEKAAKDARDHALSKLTAADRKALGL